MLQVNELMQSDGIPMKGNFDTRLKLCMIVFN